MRGLPYPKPSSAAAVATMRANRRRNTLPELRLRSELHSRGRRFRVDLAVSDGELDQTSCSRGFVSPYSWMAASGTNAHFTARYRRRTGPTGNRSSMRTSPETCARTTACDGSAGVLYASGSTSKSMPQPIGWRSRWTSALRIERLGNRRARNDTAGRTQPASAVEIASYSAGERVMCDFCLIDPRRSRSSTLTSSRGTPSWTKLRQWLRLTSTRHV
jgi:hypothetical protein